MLKAVEIFDSRRLHHTLYFIAPPKKLIVAFCSQRTGETEGGDRIHIVNPFYRITAIPQC
jgi:hypothetical protein